MQRILPYRLQLILGLVMTRLRAVVVMAAFARPCTLSPLGLPLGNVGIMGNTNWPTTRISIHRFASSMCSRARPFGRKCFGDTLLRHYGSIESRAAGCNDLRAQRTCGGRVYEARIAGVLDAMHNGGVAVVGIGERGLALDAAVRARVAAGDNDGRRLGARRESSGRGSQRSPACHRGFAGGDGGDGGAPGGFYMVRRIPSNWPSLRQ